jgi:hypothetical protein
MEASPVTVALISFIGTILVCLLSLLIAMVVSLKKDFDGKCKMLDEKMDKIQERLSHVVLIDKYDIDKREITLQLNDQEKRIIKLEIQVLTDEV